MLGTTRLTSLLAERGAQGRRSESSLDLLWRQSESGAYGISEGNKAHGRIGRDTSWKRHGCGTDSSAEQSLEGDCSSRVSVETGARKRPPAKTYDSRNARPVSLPLR
jgi:hypothetical protein